MNRVVLKVLCEWVVWLPLWQMHYIKQGPFQRLIVWYLLLRDYEGLAAFSLPYITSVRMWILNQLELLSN